MKAIPNYPDYFVTEDGRVFKRLRPGNTSGYESYRLHAPGQHDRPQPVGRLVLETYIGPCPEGKECCHRNDKRHDNRLENLYWGTRSENHTDAVKNDRYGRRLNTLQVRIIHHLLESDELSQKEIGRIFGLSESSIVINDIAHGRSWSAVTGRKKWNSQLQIA